MLRLVLGLLIISACSVEADDDAYVAVVGVGEAKAVPSLVKLRVTVAERAKDSATASRQHIEKVAAIVAEIRQTFGDEIRFTTSDVSLNSFEDRRRFTDGDHITSGFEARQSLTFDFPDKAAVEAFYPGLTEKIMGIRASIGFAFPSTDALYAKARSLAIEAARRRAETYAGGANARLGDVEIIEESGVNTHRIPFDLQDKISGTYRETPSGQLEQLTITGARVADVAESAPRLVLAPDEQSVSVTIYAKFALK